jgi:nucleoid DNA-binding protein
MAKATGKTKQMTKGQLIDAITSANGDFGKKSVKAVLETLVDVGHKELKRTGVFMLPGFAKMIVVKKPATKAHKGINPFTKEEMMFAAKPARKVVKARPMKAVKDAVA